MTSELVDRLRTSSGTYSGANANRKEFTTSTNLNDNPVTNDGTSTISKFLSRGFANFLKLHVNLINELEHYYNVSVDYDPDSKDPKTDEGGALGLEF